MVAKLKSSTAPIAAATAPTASTDNSGRWFQGTPQYCGCRCSVSGWVCNPSNGPCLNCDHPDAGHGR